MMNLRASFLAAVLAGSLAAPALAQDDTLCGGAGANGQWIGGTSETSDLAAANAAMNLQMQVPASGEAVALFSVTQDSEVRLEARGQGDGDPVIELTDANGNFVVSDDDSGGNRASRIERLLPAGDYCLSTSAFGGSPMTADIRVGLAAHEPLTDGIQGTEAAVACTPDIDAPQLVDGPLNAALGTPITAANSASATPFYRFSLTERTPLSFTLNNSDADPVLSLFDADGNLLEENDDFQGLNSRIDLADGLAAGDYCIGVRALSNPDLPINLEISEYDEQAVLRARFATAETSPPLDGSFPVEDLGVVATRMRTDTRVAEEAVWFQFEVEEPGLLLIEAIGDPNVDPMLSLFDDLGRKIEVNDDANDALDSRIAARVFPGTFVLAVHQYSGSLDSAGTIRVTIERFVPAQ